MKKALVLSLLVAAAGMPRALAQSAPQAQPAQSQENMDLTKFKMALTEARRKLFAAAMSNLTAQQLETFWGVYGDYEKEKNALTDDRLEVFKKYVDSFSNLTDADIASMVKGSADTQEKHIDLRVKYFGIYNQKLGAKVAGRFALIDDFIMSANRAYILDKLPLPGDQLRK
jgi:hypothetical protein